MPATRWNSSILEMLNWLYEEQAGLEKMIAHPIVTRVIQNEPGSESESSTLVAEDEQIPNILPILPLRGLVVFPQTAVPLTIGQARSIRLIDDVMASDVRMIALVTSRDPDLETPEPEDLFQVGTVAMVHRMFRAPDGTIRLVVQGLVRCRVLNFIQKEPYLKAEIEAAPETVEEGLELEAMARNARNQFEHIADMVPSIPASWSARSCRSKTRCKQSIPSPISSGWIWTKPRNCSSWIPLLSSCTRWSACWRGK